MSRQVEAHHYCSHQLPKEEQKYWHSHIYEVQSGMLYNPDGDAKSDLPHMEGLVNSYGKTWHTWQVDKGDKFPLGPPQLMMSFVEDGQVDDLLVKDRDARCDHWKAGQGAWQSTMAQMEFRPHNA
ncbi:hypothetical protein WJX74_009383 [Apatococcus lobatus]|uniref:DUF1264-domain-containing protein n=1 Tax=Apatococcus lobatus TaxID=904363 RepID=A0AAW1Q2J6_9CHLO